MRRKRLTKTIFAVLAVFFVQGSIIMYAHSNQAEMEVPDGEGPIVFLEESELAEYALQVLELINLERAKEGLAPLQANEELNEAAKIRAAELEELFSHTRPDGAKWSTIFAQQGLTTKNRAENIAFGHISPKRVVYKLMLSPGHRKNIMSPKYDYVGIAVHQTEDGYLAWEQLFCK